MSGAVVQADVLGILGRNDLYLVNRSSTPPTGSPACQTPAWMNRAITQPQLPLQIAYRGGMGTSVQVRRPRGSSWLLLLTLLVGAGALLGAVLAGVAVVVDRVVSSAADITDVLTDAGGATNYDKTLDLDFASARSVKRVDDGLLSWQQQDGRLTLFTSAAELQLREFEVQPTTDIGLVVTLSQPQFDAAGEDVTWGVALLDDQDDGVALLCSPGRPPRLVDLVTGRELTATEGTGGCPQSMGMELGIVGDVASFMAYDLGSSAVDVASFNASAAVDYGTLDKVAVVLASNRGEQSLHVSTIVVYERQVHQR